MNPSPIVRRVLLGAAEASLDVAGAALLPGAWPVLRGALEPVLDRLSKRLGGDVTASRERAQHAADEFEADEHLQEIFTSRLVDDLDELIARGEKLDADVHKLMLIAAGSEDTLRAVLGGIDRIDRRLEEGVDLSEEAVEKLAEAVAARAATSRSVRGLALREMGPVAELVERQVQRLQVRAVELVQEGASDRAVDELREGLLLVAALLNEAPTDVRLLLQLGFLYKTAAQAFDALGEEGRVTEYVDAAEAVFGLVMEDTDRDYRSAIDTANLVHGLGNIDQQKGALETAILKYEMATRIYPDHVYAWHDIFAANHALASTGRAHLAQMRAALDKVKELEHQRTRLGRRHVARLERALEALETQAGGRVVHIRPRWLAVVIAEDQTRLIALNITCDVFNETAERVTVRRLWGSVSGPGGRRFTLDPRLFYDVQPASGERVMRATGDPQAVDVDGGAGASIGVQFVGPDDDPRSFWLAGKYLLTVGALVARRADETEATSETRMTCRLGDYEAAQIQHWSTADRGLWDQLNDPDRAIAIPLAVDETAATFEQRDERGR